MNDQTREWSKRFQERHAKKMMPNHMHAGVYAAVLHYLKAVDKVGSPADGAAVGRGDEGDADRRPAFRHGHHPRRRPQGAPDVPAARSRHRPESKGEWDAFKIVQTIPADKAFRPLNEGGCPLVKN